MVIIVSEFQASGQVHAKITNMSGSVFNATLIKITPRFWYYGSLPFLLDGLSELRICESGLNGRKLLHKLLHHEIE